MTSRTAEDFSVPIPNAWSRPKFSASIGAGRRALVVALACTAWVGSSLAADRNLDSASSISQSSTLKADAAPGSDVGLGGEAALSRNLALYESGQYEACVQGLKQLLEVSNGQQPLRPDQLDQAEIYLGACLIARGRIDEADRVYADAIRNNPQMRAPDNLVFPQTVVDRFLHVREQLLMDIRREERNRVQDAEQRAQRQDEKRKQELQRNEQLRALASSESVVEKNKRWLAYVPFGVGQFQNGDNAAGWIFFGLETALAGTCIAAVIVDENLANRALEPGIDIRELTAKRSDAYWVKVASSWGFLTLAAVGVVHAQLRFVPERRSVRTRTLPPELNGSADIKQNNSKPAVGITLIGVQLGPQIGVFGEF